MRATYIVYVAQCTCVGNVDHITAQAVMSTIIKLDHYPV